MVNLPLLPFRDLKLYNYAFRAERWYYITPRSLRVISAGEETETLTKAARQFARRPSACSLPKETETLTKAARQFARRPSACSLPSSASFH